MWVGQNRSWVRTVLLDGFALPQIWGRTLAVTALSIGMTVLYEVVPPLHYSVTIAPFTIIGLPLGVFLGFRNNSAYDRFWEGRKLWGGLVNTSRSLTRQVLTMMHPIGGAPDAPKPLELSKLELSMVHLVIAFAYALRDHLRETDPFETLAKTLPDEDVQRLRGEVNAPLGILQRLGEHLSTAYRMRWVHAQHVSVMEGSLVSLTDIQGACERIKSTPVPYSYTVLMHRIVALYCGLLPFGLFETVDWATPLVVLAISYCMFALDAVGDEIEQPFGLDMNDLPLSAIAHTIERNLRHRIGEPGPPSLAPVRGVLS